MPPNPSFTKMQKERKRQEKAAAKRQERTERRKRSGNEPGSGPPIDFESAVVDESEPKKR